MEFFFESEQFFFELNKLFFFFIDQNFHRINIGTDFSCFLTHEYFWCVVKFSYHLLLNLQKNLCDCCVHRLSHLDITKSSLTILLVFGCFPPLQIFLLQKNFLMEILFKMIFLWFRIFLPFKHRILQKSYVNLHFEDPFQIT